MKLLIILAFTYSVFSCEENISPKDILKKTNDSERAECDDPVDKDTPGPLKPKIY